VPKKWQFFEENYFLVYFCERYKINDQGVVASPTALVPSGKIRAYEILEEENLKNLIFYEERKNLICTNEQDNFLIADVINSRENFDAKKFQEKEKLLFDVDDGPRAQSSLFVLMENRKHLKKNLFDIVYISYTLDEYNNVLERSDTIYEERRSVFFMDITNKNYKYVPKFYHTLISRSSSFTELLLYRKDTVFQKTKR
jgi:hypothetical protein